MANWKETIRQPAPRSLQPLRSAGGAAGRNRFAIGIDKADTGKHRQGHQHGN